MNQSVNNMIMVEDRHLNIYRAYRKIGGGVTTKRILAHGYTYTHEQASHLSVDAHEKYQRVWVVCHRYPYLVLDSDTHMVHHCLASRLNTVGRKMHRFVWIGEGLRSRARQQELWDQYIARNKQWPLVARPGTSRHETGEAADVSLFMYGRDKPFVNIGKVARARSIMRDEGLCLNVPGEPWHVEIGNVWRA
jgi:hypothetical protein